MSLPRTLLSCAIVTLFALSAGYPAQAADPHQGQHGSAVKPTKLVLNQGKKWATDEPLRKNMSAIRTALAAKHYAIEKGALKPDEYKALGKLVEARVATIVAECKLAPAADANLHHIVADLIASADAMQGKSATKPAMGAARTIRSVNTYGQYFDHPGWKPLG